MRRILKSANNRGSNYWRIVDDFMYHGVFPRADVQYPRFIFPFMDTVWGDRHPACGRSAPAIREDEI